MSEISEQLQRLITQVRRLEEERDELRRRISQEQDGHSAPPTPYLTVDQAAELASCSPKTIRRAVGSGHLRAFRPAGRLRLLEADVRTWVESQSATRAEAAPPGPARRARRLAPGSVAAIRSIERQLR